jgi:hypothetical protein
MAVRAASVRAGVTLGGVYTCGSGTVAQALAANGHGIALVTEPPRFGLAALPATVGSAPIEVALYASWDKTHYARHEIAGIVRALREWLDVHPAWIDMTG